MQHGIDPVEREGFGAVEVESAAARAPYDFEAGGEQRRRATRDIAEAGHQQTFHAPIVDMRKVTLQPSGLEFQAEEGEAILTAALRQNFVLPYGCRNGACGSCKGKVLEGQVDYGVYQKKALTEEEKAQGKALFCQAKPLSDVVIEARTIGAAKDIQVKTLPCRVQAMRRVADDVMVLQLKLPANERLQLLAWQ